MILFFLIFALVLYAVQQYSLEHGLDGVTLKTDLGKTVVEPGEPFSWTVAVLNQKRMMVPYLRVKEQAPEELLYAGSGVSVLDKKSSEASSVLYLAGRQRTEVTRDVMLMKRGRYFFRGASVEAGDFLGLETRTRSYTELKEIVVKPMPCPAGELTLLLGGFLGEYSVRNSLLEDPVLSIGFREYTGREPFRSISWTQSAKYGRLLVKQYECTADLTCRILLNMDCGRSYIDGEDAQTAALMERCFSMVRSVCEELENKKIPYGFLTNGIISGAVGNWKQVEDGLGAAHLETVLEGLGRMTHERQESMEEFMRRVRKGVHGAESFIVVTPVREPRIMGLVQELEERCGNKVLFLCADEMEG